MDESPPGAPPPVRKFTLKKLFGWLTLIGLTCGFLFSPMIWSTVKALGLFFLPPIVLATIAVYGSTWVRTFALGSLIPAGMAVLGASHVNFIYMVSQPNSFDELAQPETIAIVAGTYFGTLLFAGLLAVCVRWLVE